MIKVILLDVDNTLMDFRECAHQAMQFAAEEWDLTLPSNITEVFHRINDGLWHQIEEGSLTVPRLHEIRWNLIFEELGIERDGVEFEQRFLKSLAKGSATVEGAKDLLEYLAPKYTLCVASNAPYYQQTSRLTNAELLEYFQKLFISEKIGFSKPKPEFFEACMRELDGITKDEVMMIGDSLTADIGGAAAFGFQTCWFNYGGVPMEEGKMADYAVNKLSEIKNIL